MTHDVTAANFIIHRQSPHVALGITSTAAKGEALLAVAIEPDSIVWGVSFACAGHNHHHNLLPGFALPQGIKA